MANVSLELLEAIAVAAELTQTELSKPAARVMAADLAAYPIDAVISALRKCRRELSGKLTLNAVIQRIDDGRPGPEEAWAMIPASEAVSVVWTDEMAAAYGVVYPLIRVGDMIPARMAFLECYRKAVQAARERQERTRWTPSLGTDRPDRERALIEAVRRRQLTAEHVRTLLPHLHIPDASPPLLPKADNETTQ